MLRLSGKERAVGIIKALPEDFKVEEIAQNGTVMELGKKYTPEELGLSADPSGKITTFVLEKYNWNTSQALKALGKAVGRGMKSVGFAGTKDKTAQSTQLCSMFGVEPERLEYAHVKDIQVNGAWKAAQKVEMGDLAGNRFTITIKEFKHRERLDGIVSELNGRFPNYFGEQRFGFRGNNFDIGLDMLKGNYESAVMRFLTDTSREVREEAIEARKRLAAERDFGAALDYFPTYLKYERGMIDYLSLFTGNYANAIRKLPRSLSLMFIHAVESEIFNRELEDRIKKGDIEPVKGDIVCNANDKRFFDLSSAHTFDNDNKDGVFAIGNILGYNTKEPTEFERNELERLGLTLDSFKMSGMNELNCKGASRVLFALFVGFSIGEPNVGEAVVRFSLPSGSYATVFMDEMLEEKAA